jgi:hypothetical protein
MKTSIQDFRFLIDRNRLQTGRATTTWTLRIGAVFHSTIKNQQAAISSASGDGRHNGNTITVLHCGGVLLQIADIFIVEVDVYERPQFPVIGIEVAAQVRVLGHEVGKGLADGSGLYFNRRLLPGVLAQGRRDLDLGHRL